MIITSNFFEIEDQVEVLIQRVLQSKEVIDYLKNKKEMYQSQEVLEKQQAFLEAKSEFEKIEAYGKYAPDFRQKQRSVRQAKRALDMDEGVANFRISETSVQTILDIVCKEIAQTISEDIKVSAGNPFFEKENHSGCGGSCHVS